MILTNLTLKNAYTHEHDPPGIIETPGVRGSAPLGILETAGDPPGRWCKVFSMHRPDSIYRATV